MVHFIIKKIRIGYSATYSTVFESFSGIDSINWRDSDPWIILEIPKGTCVYQHIRPHKIEGRMLWSDIDSLRTALFATDISVTAGSQYAITDTGVKTKIEYFYVKVIDHHGVEHDFSITGMRIRTVDIPDFSDNPQAKSQWVVAFYAEAITKQTRAEW